MFSSFLAFAATPAFIHVQASNLRCAGLNINPTKIEVVVDHKPIDLNRDRTLRDLHMELGSALYRRDKQDDEEYYTSTKDLQNKEWLIGGTSHGNVKTNTNIEYLTIAQDERKRNYCITFKKVRVDVSYQTNMTIAQDFKEDGCEYNAVLAHEKQRHDAYTDVVNMVSDQLRADLPKLIQQYERGYVPGGIVNRTYGDMNRAVQADVSRYREQMLSMMKEFNDIVDRPEALKKLASTCQKQKIEKLKEEGTFKEPAGSLGDYLKDFRN